MKNKVIDSIRMEAYICFKNYILWLILGVVLLLSIISIYTSNNVIKGNEIEINGVAAEEIFTEVNPQKADEFYYWCEDIISGDFLIVFTIIFAALIAGKDYSSGYIKTIINAKNRQYYFVSKLVILILYITMMLIATFLATVICNIFFLKTGSLGTFSSYIRMLIMQFILNVTVGALVEMIVFIAKKQIVALIAPMVYYLFFSSMLYSIINKFIKTMEFDISKYTIFGAPKYLVGDLSNSILMREAIVLIIYLIIRIFISFEGIRRSEI